MVLSSVIKHILLNAHLRVVTKCATLFTSSYCLRRSFMTARMQKYREKKQEEGFVQVRVWVSQEHEYFIKNIAKECRPSKPIKIPERYGRPAKPSQIRLAESLAASNGKEPPEHLYDYHISLSAWMWANGGRAFNGL